MPVTTATRVRAIVCDWAGVLTNPLHEIVGAYCELAGVSPERIGAALASVAERHGADPFAELERGRMSEATFLTRVAAALAADGGSQVELDGFRSAWFAGVRPNDEFLAYLSELHGRGLQLALLTNNVHEWDAAWRAKLASLDLFSVVVTSCAEGVRKPEPAIYERTLAYLGRPASACLFIDDSPENCEGARAAGLDAIWFESTRQAIAAIDERLEP